MPGRELPEGREGGKAECCPGGLPDSPSHLLTLSFSSQQHQSSEWFRAPGSALLTCAEMKVRGGGCPPLPFPGLPSWMGTGSFPPPGSLPKALRAADISVPETTTERGRGWSHRQPSHGGRSHALPPKPGTKSISNSTAGQGTGPVPRAASGGCSQQNAVLPGLRNTAGMGTALQERAASFVSTERSGCDRENNPQLLFPELCKQ